LNRAAILCNLMLGSMVQVHLGARNNAILGFIPPPSKSVVNIGGVVFLSIYAILFRYGFKNRKTHK